MQNIQTVFYFRPDFGDGNNNADFLRVTSESAVIPNEAMGSSNLPQSIRLRDLWRVLVELRMGLPLFRLVAENYPLPRLYTSTFAPL